MHIELASELARLEAEKTGVIPVEWKETEWALAMLAEDNEVLATL